MNHLLAAHGNIESSVNSLEQRFHKMPSKFRFGMAFGEGSREPDSDHDEETLPYNHEWELKIVKETIAAKRRRHDG